MSGSVAACIQALSLRGVTNARSVIKKATEEPGNVRKVFACVTGTGSSPVLPIDLPVQTSVYKKDTCVFSGKVYQIQIIKTHETGLFLLLLDVVSDPDISPADQE